MKTIAWALALSLGALLTVPLAFVMFITTLATPAVAANTCTPPASAAGLPQPGSPRQASLHNPPTEIPAAVQALYPAATVMLAGAVDGERPQRVQWIGMVLALGAVMLVAVG